MDPAKLAKRDASGKFLKGSKLGKLGGRVPELRDQRLPVKSEVVRCAATLARPWSTLEDDIKKEGLSRLEFLTYEAVKNRHHKFIQWLLEMAVGKPKQAVEIEEAAKLTRDLFIKNLDGSGENLKIE